MAGNPPEGKRDVGALETITGCTLSVSTDSLHFDEYSSVKMLRVEASAGYSIGTTSGSFFTLEMLEDTIKVTVMDNPRPENRTGSFMLTGCGSTTRIHIIQVGAPCVFELETDSLSLSSQAQSIAVQVTTNGDIQMQSDQNFVQPALSAGQDTLWLHVSENLTENHRQARIELETCNGSSIIEVFQAGMLSHAGGMDVEDIRIFPNPMSGQELQVVLPENSGVHVYTLTDLNGKVVQQGKIVKHRQTLALDLKKGSYLLQLAGDRTQYKKTLIVL
jgi:hypothetical protein